MSPRLFVVYIVSFWYVLGAGAYSTPSRAFAGQSTAPAAPTSGPAGHWEGTIELPGMQLGVIIELKKADGADWTGKIDIPMQGAQGLPLTNISIDPKNVVFSIKGIQGNPTFNGELGGDRIEGTFTQGGASLQFSLSRERVVTGQLVRPQEPKPPFPYQERPVAIDSDGARLAGTLTIPGVEGAAPPSGGFPTVVLITGSGPQNRNEEIFGHRPFLVLADRLARAGIAVLRVDDRGTGESTGEFTQCTSEDFAKDVEACVAFLKTSSKIPMSAIGLIGHSEGALIAPIVAARNSDVKFVVLLAPPGVPGDQILARQLEQMLRGNPGVSDEEVTSLLEVQHEVLSALRETKTPAEAEPLLAAALRKQYDAFAPAKRQALGDPDEFVKTQLAAVNTPWMRYFVTLDPQIALKKLKSPAVLALFGALDMQVDADQNMDEVEKALDVTENPDVTVKELAGLNHLFQPAQTGKLDEYGEIETTMDESALTEITEWITKRFGKK